MMKFNMQNTGDDEKIIKTQMNHLVEFIKQEFDLVTEHTLLEKYSLSLTDKVLDMLSKRIN